MILLRSEEAPSRTVAVFGGGLVGSALADRLRSLLSLRLTRLPLDWRNADARDRDLRAIGSDLVASCSRPGAELTFVWAAGRAGFGAGTDEAAAELANFRAVLGLWSRCADELPNARIRSVHFSSAGGLFEGQRHVDSRAVPRPRRPYGELKEAEERVLRSTGIPATIVRLSSVYGRVLAGARAGLVSTLLLNGIRRRVSSIFGSMDTLRDFVWADDVATFVSHLVPVSPGAPETRTILLASGRPSSIFEVQKIIEDLLGYKIYVAHAPTPSNREDITFAPSVLPPGWISSDLRANVGLVYREAMRSGFGRPDLR